MKIAYFPSALTTPPNTPYQKSSVISIITIQNIELPYLSNFVLAVNRLKISVWKYFIVLIYIINKTAEKMRIFLYYCLATLMLPSPIYLPIMEQAAV